MIAIIGGTFERFRSLVDLYREAGTRAGHRADTLKVGVHVMGFVGNTDDEACNAFFPGWAHLIAKIGRECGWSPPSRAQFDEMAGPGGAFLVGSPGTAAAKMRRADEALGGVSRITFQMSTASLETAVIKRLIELLGTAVAPLIADRSRPPLENCSWQSAHVQLTPELTMKDDLAARRRHPDYGMVGRCQSPRPIALNDRR